MRNSGGDVKMQVKKWEVIKKNGIYDNNYSVIGVYSSRGRAEARVNKINNDYGAYIAYSHAVWVEM